ncbi:hypothetical protein DPMN_006092 [Dreissena polymorpha]|uniref:Uncharacterized protein n=1 Tax=Dreissena polymorpha TaxID=45954 RepID=A0A9D4MUN4_DREPO|nr:hypothetical protein DPMN_006092 [Dreissena polymorpha]
MPPSNSSNSGALSLKHKRSDPTTVVGNSRVWGGDFVVGTLFLLPGRRGSSNKNNKYYLSDALWISGQLGPDAQQHFLAQDLGANAQHINSSIRGLILTSSGPENGVPQLQHNQYVSIEDTLPENLAECDCAIRDPSVN